MELQSGAKIATSDFLHDFKVRCTLAPNKLIYDFLSYHPAFYIQLKHSQSYVSKRYIL